MAQDNFTELHVHLRGACTLDLLRSIEQNYSIEQIKGAISQSHLSFFHKFQHLQAYLQQEHSRIFLSDVILNFSDFFGFIASYLLSKYVFQTAADVQQLVHSVTQQLASQAITYAEVTVNISEYEQNGIEWDDLLECLEVGHKKAPNRCFWIIDIAQAGGVNEAAHIIDRLIEDKPSSIIGLTIGGSEKFFPRAPCAPLYKRAKNAGLKLSAHAGEVDGVESVWHAIDALGVDRVGHGVAAIHDSELCRTLVERNIPLEICPSSNLYTGVYASIETHPAYQLFKAGVPLSINTDDPTFFQTDIKKEFELVKALGFSEEELERVKNDAVKHAWGM